MRCSKVYMLKSNKASLLQVENYLPSRKERNDPAGSPQNVKQRIRRDLNGEPEEFSLT